MRAINRIIALLGAAVTIATFSGCSTPQSVTSYTHPLSGRRTDVLGQNLLDIPHSDREMIWLNAYRDFPSKHEDPKYYLEVIYGANQEAGYLEIGPGRTLTIVADGQELKFTGLGAHEKEKDGNAIFESARYEATQADIDKIAGAKDVTVRVTGSNGLVVRKFNAENSDNFRRFADQDSIQRY